MRIQVSMASKDEYVIVFFTISMMWKRKDSPHMQFNADNKVGGWTYFPVDNVSCARLLSSSVDVYSVKRFTR